MGDALDRLVATASEMLIVHRRMLEKGEGHYGLGYGLGGGSSLWDDLERLCQSVFFFEGMLDCVQRRPMP